MWKNKYALDYPHHSFIIFDEDSLGLHIWKEANKQRVLIQQHSFQEIKEGDKALFWCDSWKQLPFLKSLILDPEI